MIMKALNKIKTKCEARQIAIDWQNWQSKQSLSYGELNKWQNFFISIAKRFNLSREFKENCII